MSFRPTRTALSLASMGAALAVGSLAGAPSSVSAATKKASAKKVTSTTTRTTNTAQSAKRNVLFVLADDLGVDASPCYPAYGSAKPVMPTLEQLCRDGVVFDNMTASPVCSPSRAAVLTGRYGFRTNVGNVDDELSADETTVQDVLANAPTPYVNAVIGKWHLGGAQPDPTQPERLGVQYFDGFLRAQVQDYSNWPRVTQGQTSTSTTYTTTAFTDSAIAWTSKQTRPWFLWLAYNAPHVPFHRPPVSLVPDPSLTGAADDIAQNPQKYYFAALTALDKELGRLLASMPAATRQHTAVMFMGDNGTPSRVAQAPFSADTSKGTVNEGGVHVPLIVAGAGVTQKGTRNASLLNGVDLFPTIADIAGAKVPVAIDGVSFAGAFATPGFSGSRMYAYSEIFTGTKRAGVAARPAAGAGGRPARPGAPAAGGGGGTSTAGVDQWAVRDDRYKLVHDVPTGDEQVFDLQTDPSESQPMPTTGPLESVANRLREFVTRLKG